MKPIQTVSEIVEEIHFKNMKFKLVSSRPQYSKEDEIKVKEDMCKKLFHIFSNHEEKHSCEE